MGGQRDILGQCRIENASGSAGAIDQKGLFSWGGRRCCRSERRIISAEAGGELGDLRKWVLKCSPEGRRWRRLNVPSVRTGF